jgi:hypothetical protein
MAFSPNAGAVISFAVEGASTAQREIETIGNSFNQLSSVATTGLKALVAGYAALNIGAYVKDATLLAARYETLGIVMHTAGENAGYSSTQMDTYAKGLERSGISMMKAREAMVSMTTANLDNNKSLELGRMAQNLAVVANKSSSETLTQLITNIQQADTEGLKYMGIILNQDEALQKYATSHGTVTKALTQTQKAEAIQQAVMQEGAKYAGIYEKAMGTAGKALSSLDRYFENIQVRLGTPFLEGFAQGVFGVTDGVKQLNVYLEELESNGAMEKMAKVIGSTVGTVISVFKDVASIVGSVIGVVADVGKAFGKFFDDYLGGMTTIKGVTITFALLLSGFMVEQATIGFGALVAQAWAAAGKVGLAFVAMGAAATNFFRALQLSAAIAGWGSTILLAGRMLVTGLATAVAAIPGAVGAAVVAAGLAVGYVFAKAFGDQLERLVPKSIDDVVNKGVAWLVSKTSSLPEISEPTRVEDPSKAAANKAERDRKEQLIREMNDSVVAAEGQISIVSAANTKLKALNDLRDQQLKQSLDQRVITQAEYLEKKQKLDVAEAQGQLDQIAAQKAQLVAYMAAFKAGAPLGQGRDPAADANEMIKLSGEAAAAQTKLNAVKQNYAYQIAGALLEGYTKEFGSVSSLVDAQEDLVRSSRLAYAVAGQTAEQQEIYSALRMQSIAKQLSAEMEQRRQSGDATREYLDSTGAMVRALEQMGAARLKAVNKGVATGFVNDTKQMADETIALYDAMRDTFIGDEEERIRAAAAASIKLASIRLTDANAATDKTNDTDGQKLAAKKQALADFNRYAQAVQDNADAKVLQSSRGFETLRDAIDSAFNVNRIESFGQAMSGAFGNAGTALGNLIDTFSLYDQQQRDNEAARKTASVQYKDDAGKLAAAQAAITTKQEREQLGYYSNVASAAKGFFKENSTGYKVMEGVEKAYRAAELALALESMAKKILFKETEVAANTTLNATKLAGEATSSAASTGLAATEASAWGITAVVKAIASLPFPLNLAAGAATLAAVVAIGAKMVGGLGGSSVSLSQQRQEQQGTGTVLGDKSAKSESIARAIELSASNSSTQINYLSAMTNSLRAIENNISSFAAQLVQNSAITDPNVGSLSNGNGGVNTAGMVATGAAVGSVVPIIGTAIGAAIGYVASKIPVLANLFTSVFGGKQSVTDSGFTVAPTSLGSVLENGVTAQSYANIHTSGGLLHGSKDEEKKEYLSDDANRQFASVITSLADSIKIAGGLLGVSGDDFATKLNSFVVDIGKVSLKDLKGDELQKAIESVFSKLGDDMAKYAVSGLEQFEKVGEGYLETLVRVASDYAKLDASLASIGTTFGATGMESIAARESLIELMGGIDQLQSTTADFAENFLTEAQRLAPVQKYVSDELAKLNLSWVDTREEFAQVALGLDKTTAAGQATYATLMGLEAAFAATHEAIKDTTKSAQDIADERSDLQDQIDELTMTAIQLRAKERAGIADDNKALYDHLQALKDHAAGVEATKDAATALLAGVDSAFTALQSVVSREKTAVQTMVDAHSAAVTKLQSLSDALHSTLDSLQSPDQKLAQRAVGQAQIRAALATAKAGGPLPDADGLKDALSAVQQDASDQFTTYADYLRDLYQTQNDIGALAGLTDSSLTVEEQALQAAKDQLTSLDGILTNAQALIDEAKGQSTTLLSIDQAMGALTATILAAQANPVVSATSSINQAYQQALGRTPDAAGLEFWQNQAAAGTSTSSIVNAITGSAEAKNRTAISQLYKELLGRDADAGGLAFYASNGSSLADIATSIKSSDEYKKLHPFAIGTNYVPEDMPAFIHAGERIIPAGDNRELMRRLSSPSENSTALVAELRALRAEVQALREDNSAENLAIAKGTQATADHLDSAVNGDVPFATKVVPA